MARRRRRTSRRRIRRAPRRIFRRRRSRRSKSRGRRRGGSLFSRSWGKITTAIGGLAFFQQVTGEDMHNAANLPIGDKAKVFLSSLTGRIFGVGLIPGMAAPPQTFNFAGIFNKWSGLGAGLWLIGKAPIGLPHKGKASTLGKKLLTAGILGGFFSPGTGHLGSSHMTHAPALQSFVFAGGTQGGQ